MGEDLDEETFQTSRLVDGRCPHVESGREEENPCRHPCAVLEKNRRRDTAKGF
jgi:hypothetical protein